MTKCSCLKCGGSWNHGEWNKQQNSLYRDHGYRFTQEIQMELCYRGNYFARGEGLCRPCFKNHLRRDIEQHLD